MSEEDKINQISAVSLYSAGVMPVAIDYCFSILQRHVNGGTLLELGPAEGVMTKKFVEIDFDVSVVEGSSLFCQNIKEEFPSVRVYNELFENFETSEKFDTIVLGHVLEHVQDPVGILSKFKKYLRDDGVIFAAVPNALSIHRQAAVHMRLLQDEHELNELDIHHGHRCVFNPGTFKKVFENSGLPVTVFGGYWLKPVTNGQIEQSWTPDMISAFMALGEKYPEIAGEIYIVSRQLSTDS